jgi:hypothetical protein
LGGDFSNFKKKCLKYWLTNLKIFEAIFIELFVDMKNLQKIVEVDHKTTLENFVPLKFYFKIDLKDISFDSK